MTITVSPEQVQAYLVNHHRLRPSPLPTLNQPSDVFHHLRSIQYDPLNPCGRNIDLVLQARLQHYHPNDYLDWAYNQRGVIEGYDKVLCLLPVADWSYLHHSWSNLSTARRQFATEHQSELARILQKITDQGPIASGDLKDSRKTNLGWHNQTPWGKVALEVLWQTGQIVTIRDHQGRKVYDLPQRVYGQKQPKQAPSMEKQATRRLQSAGLLPLTGSGDGWLGLQGPHLRNSLKNMQQSGQIIQINVSGIDKPYCINPDQLTLLENPPTPNEEMVFLAPLDNFMWDRQLIEDVFGFRYRWEVYTPAAKRQFGHYVLPILYGHQLIGRIEPQLISGSLQIKGLWWQDNFKPTPSQLAKYQQAIGEFAKYLNAELHPDTSN